MTLRTILVCLTSTKTSVPLLQAAAVLARRDNAHVIGLYVTESLVMYSDISMHLPGETFENFVISQQAHAKEVEAIFEAQTRLEDFSSEWRMVNSESGFLADSFVASARSADLVIMAQEDDGEDRPQIDDLQERVIKGCGRPVLVIPKGYRADRLGEKIVLGWSETREATRAMHDLVFMAKSGAQIRVLRVGKPPQNALADYGTNDLAVALARHGAQVNVVHRDKDGEKVADVLNHEAFEMGADMIATGAFGHSRAYDFVIGAATRGLLRNAKLPVLFSK